MYMLRLDKIGTLLNIYRRGMRFGNINSQNTDNLLNYGRFHAHHGKTSAR